MSGLFRNDIISIGFQLKIGVKHDNFAALPNIRNIFHKTSTKVFCISIFGGLLCVGHSFIYERCMCSNLECCRRKRAR